MHRIVLPGPGKDNEMKIKSQEKERKTETANKSVLLVPASIGQPCRQSGKQSPCPIRNECPGKGRVQDQMAITLDTTPGIWY